MLVSLDENKNLFSRLNGCGPHQIFRECNKFRAAFSLLTFLSRRSHLVNALSRKAHPSALDRRWFMLSFIPAHKHTHTQFCFHKLKSVQIQMDDSDEMDTFCICMCSYIQHSRVGCRYHFSSLTTWTVCNFLPIPPPVNINADWFNSNFRIIFFNVIFSPFRFQWQRIESKHTPHQHTPQQECKFEIPIPSAQNTQNIKCIICTCTTKIHKLSTVHMSAVCRHELRCIDWVNAYRIRVQHKCARMTMDRTL